MRPLSLRQKQDKIFHCYNSEVPVSAIQQEKEVKGEKT